MSLHSKTFSFPAGILALISMCLQPASAHYVLASADMDLFDLSFSSPDPQAELIWTDDWYATVTAHAQDTNSGSDDDFDELLGNDGFIDAEASTAHVYSDATYSVINGDLVAIDLIADIGATTHSDLELTGKYEQADGFAVADFDNFFVVVGGTPGDPVEVTFELDYEGQLTGIADEEGFFDIALAGLLELYDVAFELLEQDLFFDSHSGSNTSFQQDYTGTLSVTAQLSYEEEYWLFAEADSEVFGVTVPLPGSLLLIVAGLGALGWRARLATSAD